MSYELKSLRRIGPHLREIFDEEVAAAIGHLEGLTGKNVVHGTHEARKHFKKLRALLRLVRDRIGKTASDAGNACFRAAGRKLRALRDAQVLVEALATVRKRFFHRKHPALFAHARKLLAADEQQCLDQLTQGATLADVVADLRAVRKRGAEWDWKGFGWKETRQALKRTYKRGRGSARRAFADPSVEHLHEWRKRVKDLGYHARLLRKPCPAFMNELSDELEVLSEFLGDDHDLAVLREALVARSEVLGRPEALAALLKKIDRRRGELSGAAIDLGKRLYAQPASAFAGDLKVNALSARSDA